MAVAVIAPVWSADPRAVTHLPVARLELLVLEVWEYVVLALVVTSMDVAGGAVVVVVEELEGRAPAPLRSTPSMVKPSVDTWVTLPVAKAKLRNVPVPPGTEPRLGNVPPGVVPLPRKPPPPPPPKPPPPKPPAAIVVQLPLAGAGVIVTLVAVTGPLAAPLEAGVPVTVTQSPTATAAAVAVTVWENAVAEVQLTVTWPL